MQKHVLFDIFSQDPIYVYVQLFHVNGNKKNLLGY